MKVICKQNSCTENQNIKYGYKADSSYRFNLTIGKEYTVLGINSLSTSRINTGCTFLLRDDIDMCAFVPICLLEISNPSPSKFWVASIENEFDFSLGPPEFDIDCLIDRASDYVPEAVAIFDKICRILEEEANNLG